MAGDISTGTTNLANLTIGGGGFGTGGFGGNQGGGNSNNTAYGNLDLRTNRANFSMATLGTDSGRTLGQLTIVFAASGISLMYSSGKTSYVIGGSATSAAQG